MNKPNLRFVFNNDGVPMKVNLCIFSTDATTSSTSMVQEVGSLRE